MRPAVISAEYVSASRGCSMLLRNQTLSVVFSSADPRDALALHPSLTEPCGFSVGHALQLTPLWPWCP